MYVKIHRIVHFKYVQFMIHEFYPNKVVKIVPFRNQRHVHSSVVCDRQKLETIQFITQ